MTTVASKTLPSRKICYAYAVAMHFAQHLEQNLRAILYTADYHGWIPEIGFTPEEKKRYKDSEDLIDNATCGRLIEALRRSDWIKDRKAISLFERACKHRNTLAHKYLASRDYDGLTKAKEKDIVHELYAMTADVYGGLLLTRALRERCEVEGGWVQKYLANLAAEIGLGDWSAPDMQYSTRKKKK